jgi:hypothetical protein
MSNAELEWLRHPQTASHLWATGCFVVVSEH